MTSRVDVGRTVPVEMKRVAKSVTLAMYREDLLGGIVT